MLSYNKYDWVNALRGYAILLVILIHASQTFKVSDLSRKFCDNGELGVQLFFILSSFTLFNSYSQRLLKEKNSVNRNFFIRRFFRIAPYYYIAGLIYVFYKGVIKHNEISIKNLVANYTFTNGIYLPGINDIPPGGWSIGIEMLFYLLIPLLFKYINSLNRAFYLFIFAVIFSIIINHYFLNYTLSFLNSIFGDVKNWMLYFWFPNQFPIFILGIILYYINKNIVIPFKFGQIILVISIILYLVFSFIKFRLDYPFYFFKREYIFGVIFVLFAIGTYTTKNKLIINNFVQKIGIVSFSMYLNHSLILSLIGYTFKYVLKKAALFLSVSDSIFENDIVFLFVYFLIIMLTYFASKITYKYIELKGINLGDRLLNSWSKNVPINFVEISNIPKAENFQK